MSHHSGGVLHVRPPWQAGRPNRAEHPLLYLVATPLPTLQRLLLVTIANTVLAQRPCTPSQARLGEIVSRSRETVNRALRALQAQRLIWVRRRGRRLTNVYLLARRIWEAITGKKPPYWKERQLHLSCQALMRSGMTGVKAAMATLGYG